MAIHNVMTGTRACALWQPVDAGNLEEGRERVVDHTRAQPCARREREGVEGEENTEEEGGAATPQVFSPRAGEEATRGACLSRLRGGVRCDGVFSLLWWGVWYPGGGDC